MINESFMSIFLRAVAFIPFAFSVAASAVELNTHAVEIKAPKDIQWVRNKEGTSEHRAPAHSKS